MLLSIPHFLLSVACAVVLLAVNRDRPSTRFLQPLRQHRWFRLAEYGLASFGAEFPHVLALFELGLVAVDAVTFGFLGPLFYLASALSIMNLQSLAHPLRELLAARLVAKRVVGKIVKSSKVPRTPSNFELICWRPAFDIFNLVFNVGVTIYRDGGHKMFLFLHSIVSASLNESPSNAVVYATESELASDRGTDLAYKRLRNSCDILLPYTAHEGSNLPVLLYIHGGAWMYGDKSYPSSPLLPDLARQGWVVVNTNYRLTRGSYPAIFPEYLIDIKRCIRWVRQNIARYGGNPDFIALSGGSAGGHLATLAALTSTASKAVKVQGGH